jgi:uncharacterized membrane protein
MFHAVSRTLASRSRAAQTFRSDPVERHSPDCMDFLLWAARGLHVFGVVVWLGGLTYQAAVTSPVARFEHTEFGPETRHFIRRFVPFVWLCVWTILITGVGLMLFNPRFVFFQYQDRWSIALGLKQLIFVLMVVFSFGYARMVARMEELLSATDARPLDDIIPYHQRVMQFGKINVGLGIVALLLAAAMK